MCMRKKNIDFNHFTHSYMHNSRKTDFRKHSTPTQKGSAITRIFALCQKKELDVTKIDNRLNVCSNCYYKSLLTAPDLMIVGSARNRTWGPPL